MAMALNKLQRKMIVAQGRLGSDSLQKARDLIKEVRDLNSEIEDLQARITEKTARVREIQEQELVELFTQIGITEMKIDGDGNQPEYTCKIRPYYSAGIAASWDEDRKAAGYNYLESVGAGDLIKRTFSVDVDRDDPDTASRVRKTLDKLHVVYDEKKTVHAGTLKAWLREQVEKEHSVPDRLDLIGGSVGQVAELKPVKARKGK